MLEVFLQETSDWSADAKVNGCQTLSKTGYRLKSSDFKAIIKLLANKSLLSHLPVVLLLAFVTSF